MIYPDPTADTAIGRVTKWEKEQDFRRQAIDDMARIQQYAESLGWRIQGNIQLWHRDTRKRVDLAEWK